MNNPVQEHSGPSQSAFAGQALATPSVSSSDSSHVASPTAQRTPPPLEDARASVLRALSGVSEVVSASRKVDEEARAAILARRRARMGGPGAAPPGNGPPSRSGSMPGADTGLGLGLHARLNSLAEGQVPGLSPHGPGIYGAGLAGALHSGSAGACPSPLAALAGSASVPLGEAFHPAAPRLHSPLPQSSAGGHAPPPHFPALLDALGVLGVPQLLLLRSEVDRQLAWRGVLGGAPDMGFSPAQPAGGASPDASMLLLALQQAQAMRQGSLGPQDPAPLTAGSGSAGAQPAAERLSLREWVPQGAPAGAARSGANAAAAARAPSLPALPTSWAEDVQLPTPFADPVRQATMPALSPATSLQAQGLGMEEAGLTQGMGAWSPVPQRSTGPGMTQEMLAAVTAGLHLFDPPSGGLSQDQQAASLGYQGDAGLGDPGADQGSPHRLHYPHGQEGVWDAPLDAGWAVQYR
uniref:Uncharacterized protein n=1 Tax=Auxenochlorella protothecoides TaxID=3075 RepID=A0A1D1ZZC0_AUXPR